ncbi:MAG: hypothetical protein NZM04_09325 [Methylacidiphilales bacterium]|nr:hypothetical protein [Candidatus Methylacidiphilales bacterium]
MILYVSRLQQGGEIQEAVNKIVAIIRDISDIAYYLGGYMAVTFLLLMGINLVISARVRYDDSLMRSYLIMNLLSLSMVVGILAGAPYIVEFIKNLVGQTLGLSGGINVGNPKLNELINSVYNILQLLITAVIYLGISLDSVRSLYVLMINFRNDNTNQVILMTKTILTGMFILAFVAFIPTMINILTGSM